MRYATAHAQKKRRLEIIIVKIKEIFGLDIRSLALFRIGLGLFIILDLINRALYLEAHYTDFGIMPLNVLKEQGWNKWYFSFHALSGTFAFEVALFVIAGIFAIMLLIGYQTKIAIIASWVLNVSLQNRNFMLLQGGDVIFRLLLLWAIFLPLEAYWSIKRKQEYPQNIFSAATIGLSLQIAFMYFFSALLKTGEEWKNGTAIYYALSIDQFVKPFGEFLLQFPTIMKYLTHGIVGWELIGPILLFSPFFFQQIRIFSIFLLLLMTAGFGLTLDIGHFPWACAIGLVALLPSGFWEKINIKMQSSPHLTSKKNRWHTYANIMAAFLIFYILLWNIGTLGKPMIANDMRWIGNTLRLDQRWAMFAPFPLKEDGWYVIPSTLTNKNQVDVFTNRPTKWEKPEHIRLMYPTQRWQKYMMNLWLAEHNIQRERYAAYLCRAWNRDHKGLEQLESLEIYFMRENTIASGAEEPKKILIFSGNCEQLTANL